MKKKTLANLLQKIEEAHIENIDNISNLNDDLSKTMLKGGYDTTNGNCHGGYNTSCDNTTCSGTTNGDCTNAICEF